MDKPNYFQKPRFINCSGHLLDLSTPIVMGILNVTPDSFYDGGQNYDEESIFKSANQILDEGATILDIGAVSTRPGAAEVTENEELRRLDFALSIIRKKFPKAIISVDTYRANVAKSMYQQYSIDIINDISAGEMDNNMPQTVADLGLPYIIMHLKGTPQTMQQNPQYQNITKEIIHYFSLKIERFMLMGIKDMVIDPGFGFGKTIDHNYQLLHDLDDFKVFERPVLIGVSRKSMIYKFLEISSADSLNGTTVLNTIALLKGADILRVHDVKAAVELIKLVKKTNMM